MRSRPRDLEVMRKVMQQIRFCTSSDGVRIAYAVTGTGAHITSIFAKLEVDNRARAIVLAREAGFGARRDGSAPR
jgi:hypothetical protein